MKNAWTLFILFIAAVFSSTIVEADSGDFSGGVAIGADYANTTAAPTNGAIIEGNVGIGTSSPANALDVGTGGGIHIANGTPSSTSMALYNNSGILVWNGATVGTGSSVIGTTNYIPYFVNSTGLADSIIYQSSNRIGIGTTTPSSSLDLSANTDALALPVGSTSQQPGSPVVGMIRYNNTNNIFEGYSGSTPAWGPIGSTSINSSGRLTCGGSNCSNTTGSTTLDYCPYKGNIKTTASQGNYTIPSSCLSSTLTSMYVGGVSGSSVSANTLYYIYLWQTSGTWVLDAETTGHTTDSSTGIEIMNGDNTKTLVGMIHTDANKHIMTGGQTVTAGDTNTVATWDNRAPTYTQCKFTANRTLSTTTYTEINSENRCRFMSWGDAAVFTSSQNASSNTTGSPGSIVTEASLDSVANNVFGFVTVAPPGTGEDVITLPAGMNYPSEGFHFTILAGTQNASGVTVTYLSGHASQVYTIQ